MRQAKLRNGLVDVMLAQVFKLVMPPPLDPEAVRLYKYLVNIAPTVELNNLNTFPTYMGVHEALCLEMIGRTWGDSLEKQGMSTLAQWVSEQGFPAITGFVIDKEAKRPANGFFRFHSKDPDADAAWWFSEVSDAKAFPWPVSSSAVSSSPVVGQDQTPTVDPNGQGDARTVRELARADSKFFLKSEWGPISPIWPALSFSKRSVGEYLNREYDPRRDFIVYAGTSDPERTKVEHFRKRLLSILVAEPGELIPTEELVPWESWKKELDEHGKVWPHSFGVRKAWSIVDLPWAADVVPLAYRSLGVRSNWGGVVEITRSEREALLPLGVQWVNLPKREAVQRASGKRDQLRDLKANPLLNSALTRMTLLIQSRLGGPRSVRRDLAGRNLPLGTNLIELLHKKWVDQNGRCALCGQVVRLDTEKKLLQCSPDRKDSNNPSYGDDNLQITHLACNLAKNDGTTEDFEEWLGFVSGDPSELS